MCGIALSGEVIDRGNPLELVLSHSNPKRQARIANAVVDGLPKAGGVHDIRPDHTPVIRVASLNAGGPPPALRRKDSQRVVTVAADVDPR